MTPGCRKRAQGLTVIVMCLLPATRRSGAIATALAETPEGVVEARGTTSPGGSAAQRRRELYDLQRQDGAAALAREGVQVEWQQHSLAEMRDWQDRLGAARALRTEFSVYMNWRITSLAELTELRLRAAKAAVMANDFGVRVDWPRYSWADLEALRKHLAQLNFERTASRTSPRTSSRSSYQTADAADGLASPWTSMSAMSAMSDRRPASKQFPRGPDAIVEPTFASSTPGTGVPRRVLAGRPADPDAILLPTFAAMTTARVKAVSSCGADDIMDPWNPAFRSMDRGR
jgi:hypothetical protein